MRRKFLSSLLLALLLSSCHSGEVSFDSSDSVSPSITSASVPDEVRSSRSETTSSSSSETPKETEINIYAINDFHGAIEESGDQPGILKLGSYLKEKRKEENTILLNSGDMFQGSFASNYNRGAFLEDIMNDIHFDAFTIGNHEFDWGQDALKNLINRKNSTTQYSTPYLGANIYNYNIETDATGDFANIGEKYTITTLANGLKVGIIGIIGENQITSITSSYVENLTFVDPVPVVKTLSDELKTEKGCDVVLLSAHTDEEDLLSQGLTSISPNSKKKYVDAVFCAHTHQKEKTIENGVAFLQGGTKGEYVSHIKLKFENGSTTTEVYSNNSASYLTYPSIDPSIQNIYATYRTETNTIANQKVATLSKKMGRYHSDKTPVMNLVTEAFGSYALDKNGNNFASVSYSIGNVSRSYLPSGDVTYGQLFEALPFDNRVYIGTAKGADIYDYLTAESYGNYANFFTRYDAAALDTKKTYRIAIIDYCVKHRNVYRALDYFPSFVEEGYLKKNGQDWNYREVTKDYLATFPGTVQVNNYASSLAIHDASKLEEAITL